MRWPCSSSRVSLRDCSCSPACAARCSMRSCSSTSSRRWRRRPTPRWPSRWPTCSCGWRSRGRWTARACISASETDHATLAGALTAMANTWLELDRANLLHNLARLRAVVHPARLMPVVKANAYGAGAIPVATALASEGVDAFAVASVPEAVELRQAGIAATILVLTYFDRHEVDAILEHDLRPGVFTADAGRWLSEGARRRGVTAHVWVKVDTGLG